MMKGNPSGKAKNPPSYDRGTYGAKGVGISFGKDQHDNKKGQLNHTPIDMGTTEFSRTKEQITRVSGKSTSSGEASAPSMNMSMEEFDREAQTNEGEESNG